MPRGKGGKRFSGVKAVVTKKYAALDGKEFDTPEEAAAHSAKGAYKLLHRMTEADIENMLNGTDPKRVEIFLKLARKLETVRKASPDYVPRPRKARAPAPAPAPENQYAPV